MWQAIHDMFTQNVAHFKFPFGLCKYVLQQIHCYSARRDQTSRICFLYFYSMNFLLLVVSKSVIKIKLLLKGAVHTTLFFNPLLNQVLNCQIISVREFSPQREIKTREHLEPREVFFSCLKCSVHIRSSNSSKEVLVWEFKIKLLKTK